MNCQEYREIISAHVDGVLVAEEGVAVQSHLNQCPKCAQMFLWEARVTSLLKRKLSPVPARPALREKIFDQLEGSRKERLLGWFTMGHGLAAAFALLLIVAVPYLLWQRETPAEIFMGVISQYQRVAKGEAGSPEPSLTPAATLLDLSPWGYQMLSRQTRRVKGQEARSFVYQGQGEEMVLAQEFEGLDISTPPGGRVIRASSRDFVSYSQGGVNLVAWKEKDMLCILTSTLPREKLLRLAQKVVSS